MRGFVVAALLLVAACGSPDNQQYLPIGTRCTESGQCGTKPFFCRETGYPGGYCEKPCTGDGDCPSDAICVGSACRRKCSDVSLCRATEGYVCKSGTATTTYCDVAQGGSQPDMSPADL